MEYIKVIPSYSILLKVVVELFVSLIPIYTLVLNAEFSEKYLIMIKSDNGHCHRIVNQRPKVCTIWQLKHSKIVEILRFTHWVTQVESEYRNIAQ